LGGSAVGIRTGCAVLGAHEEPAKIARLVGSSASDYFWLSVADS